MLYPAVIMFYDNTTKLGLITNENGRISVVGEIETHKIFKICHDSNGKYEEYYPQVLI